MSAYDWIKKRDRLLADQVAGDPLYFFLSPTRCSLFQKLAPMIRQHLHGRCLDAGAGRMAYFLPLRDSVSDYVAMDIQPRPGLNAVGSVLELPWRDEMYDSVFCSQVLEHVPDPERAIREFFRVLKPGGTVLISVPHLAYLHNEPHDYTRFTRHGLCAFLQRCGFEVLEVVPAGGLLSFLGHIPSVVLKAVFSPIPFFNRPLLRLNAAFAKSIAWLDEKVETRKIYALNTIAVARKPGG